MSVFRWSAAVIALAALILGGLAAARVVSEESASPAGTATVTVPTASSTTSEARQEPAATPAPATPERRSDPLPRPTMTLTPQSSAMPRTAAPKPTTVAQPAGLPLDLPTGDAGQVITVTAPSKAATSGRIQAWGRTENGWQPRGPALFAWLGTNGLSDAPREGLEATPIGSFTLTQAFGHQPNPGTNLAYFQTDAADWWVGDTSSPQYNQRARCTSCPFDTSASEHLRSVGYLYDRAVVIDYNRFPVRPGAGSAFFLHVSEGKPTQGCVSMDRAALEDLMRWLTPQQRPRILIGVA